jgi:hypothetical protein
MQAGRAAGKFIDFTCLSTSLNLGISVEMGGNCIFPPSLTCENIADFADSFGNSYSIYGPRILEYGIDGVIPVEYSSAKRQGIKFIFYIA